MEQFKLYPLPEDKIFGKFTEFAMRDEDGNIFEPYEDFSELEVGSRLTSVTGCNDSIIIEKYCYGVIVGIGNIIRDTDVLLINFRKKDCKYIYENGKLIKHPYFGNLVGKIDIKTERYQEND